MSFFARLVASNNLFIDLESVRLACTEGRPNSNVCLLDAVTDERPIRKNIINRRQRGTFCSRRSS